MPFATLQVCLFFFLTQVNLTRIGCILSYNQFN